MEKELVPNNTTLASLRGLLREARKNVAPEEAIHIGIELWDYGCDIQEGKITERIGVYKSGTEEGTNKFRSVKKARSYINSWKEEADGSDT